MMAKSNFEMQRREDFLVGGDEVPVIPDATMGGDEPAPEPLVPAQGSLLG